MLGKIDMIRYAFSDYLSNSENIYFCSNHTLIAPGSSNKGLGIDSWW